MKNRQKTTLHASLTIWLLLAVCSLHLAGNVWACDGIVWPDSSVLETKTCYKDEFKNLDSYLSRSATRELYKDPAQLKRAKFRYKWWRDNFDCQWISYQVDGLEVQGFYVKPTKPAPENGWPVVIFNHGGNADNGQVRFQYIAAKLYPLVQAGFVVIGSQYRGARIDGKPNPDRLKDEFGGKDVNDVLALLPIIKAMPFADEYRIGMWGISRGGMMTYLAARQSTQIDTIVVQSTPVDLFTGLKYTPDMEKVFNTWIPGYHDHRDGALKSRSAIYWLDQLKPDVPILILHGGDDRRVSVMQALHTAMRLHELNRQYKLIIYDEGSHSLRNFEQEVSQQVIDWYKQKLLSEENSY